jgi:FMN phosphatase YigB (HAD superfamily)
VIKAIVFDLGKVLLEFDFGRAASNMTAFCKLAPAEIRKALDQSALLHRYETGLMSDTQFFEAVREATGFRGTESEFGRCFGDIFSTIDPMIEFHESLRRAGWPTYIFSNTNGLAIGFIRRQYPFFANFTDYIFSYEHGAMKPDAKLYGVVEQVTGMQGGELLYLDDRMENVAAGEARGWQVILQETPEKTLRRVAELGLLNGSAAPSIRSS